MDITNLVNIVVYMLLISAVVEKIIEIVKSTLKLTDDKQWKQNIIHLMSFGLAACVAYIVPPTGVFLLESLPKYVAIPLVALLGSSGSSVWHDLVSLLYDFRQNQKALLYKPVDPNSKQAVS